jgi:hypothetical protein
LINRNPDFGVDPQNNLIYSPKSVNRTTCKEPPQTNMEGEEATSNLTFEFPIRDIEEEAPMKTIPLSSLPNFHGISSEDPDTFIFKFDVLCRSYDYVSECSKTKIISYYTQECSLAMVHGTW